jgi:AraC-like DNA-binding protein
MHQEYPKVYLYKRIVQAKLFIDSYFQEDIDVNNISDEAYFSKFHFIRLFKKVYGKTPHQYLISVRIDKAKNLLRQNQPVSQACLEVGFKSVSSFTGLFKKVVGKTPSEYRLEQQSIKKEINTTPLNFVPVCFASERGWLRKSNFEEAEEQKF